MFWALCLMMIGFTITSLFAVLFKQTVVENFSNKSQLFVDYYWYIIPLGLATLVFTFFESYLRSLHKTVVPAFVNEVLLRLLIMASIVIYALKIINFETFIIVYVIANVLPALIVLTYTAFLKELFLKPQLSVIPKRLFQIMIVFGLFSFLNNVSSIIISTIDLLMVTKIIGLKATGIYTTMVFITSVLIMPYRSIIKVTAPIVSELWKKKDLIGLEDLYKRVSASNLIVGGFIFILLWTNIDNILRLMPGNYEAGKYVFLFMGLGKLFDMATGLNGVILGTSKKYRFDIIFTLLLVVLTITNNYFLIPIWGINGAAIASMITLFLYNTLRLLYVLYKFKIQPFKLKQLIVVALGLLVVLLNIQIEPLQNIFIDGIIRSTICCIVFILPVFLLKISPDLNNMALNIKDRIFKRN